MRVARSVFSILVVSACGGDGETRPPDGVLIDASSTDGAPPSDAATPDDAASPDAGAADAGTMTDAAASPDATPTARTWSTPVLAAEHACEPAITMDPAGTVTAAWYRHFGDP